MRIPYTPNPRPTKSDEEAAILQRILARRGPGGPVELDRAQVHELLIADGFNAYAKALRTQNGLPARIRELCFCRVSALLGAWYEWDIHASITHAAV